MGNIIELVFYEWDFILLNLVLINMLWGCILEVVGLINEM